jgi:hypothetical protein
MTRSLPNHVARRCRPDRTGRHTCVHTSGSWSKLVFERAQIATLQLEKRFSAAEKPVRRWEAPIQTAPDLFDSPPNSKQNPEPLMLGAV